MEDINKAIKILKFLEYEPKHDKEKRDIYFVSNGFDNFSEQHKQIIRILLGERLSEFYYGGDTQHIYYRSLKPITDKSTLEAKILPGRKVGNTTRQVDIAIQFLFEGRTVVVRDHYLGGIHIESNALLLKRICERLQNEHPYLYTSERVYVDEQNLRITITPSSIK